MNTEAKTFINGSDIKIPTTGNSVNYYYTPGTWSPSPQVDFKTYFPAPPAIVPESILTAEQLLDEVEIWNGKDKDQEALRWELLVKHAQKQIENLKAE